MSDHLLTGAAWGFLAWAALVVLVLGYPGETRILRLLSALPFCVTVGLAIAWLTQ